MENQNIIIEKRNQIGIITIDCNDGMNILSQQTLGDLADRAVELDMTDTVKAIVIRGTEKVFSTGIDVNEFAANVGKNRELPDEMYADFEKIADLKKPVIAAVSGYALGIGCELALAADIILASENACFGLPDLSLGTIPGFGATQRLPQAVGKAKAMEMILSGRGMNAPEAERIGLISRIVPLRYLFKEAAKCAERIAAMPDLATNTSKELIKTAVGNTALAEGLEIEKQVYKSALESEEFKQKLYGSAKKA